MENMVDNLISVIMCVYNEHVNDLRLAVESILNQSYKNFEFIILVEFDSKRELIELVENYKEKDERVSIFYNKQKLGLPETLNLGLNYSKGEFIARMDADDVSYLDRLMIQKDFLDSHKDVSLVSGNCVQINESNEIIRLSNYCNDIGYHINKIMKYGNIIVHPCVMFRKKDVLELGGYRDLKAAEDYDLWLRMLSAGKKLSVIDVVLLKYRIRNESASNRNRIKLRLTSKILSKYYKHNKVPSLKQIDKYIERYKYFSTDRLLKSYSLFNESWIKKQNHNYFGFIKDFSFSVFLNFDVVNILFDSILFNYYLKKSS